MIAVILYSICGKDGHNSQCKGHSGRIQVDFFTIMTGNKLLSPLNKYTQHMLTDIVTFFLAIYVTIFLIDAISPTFPFVLFQSSVLLVILLFLIREKIHLSPGLIIFRLDALRKISFRQAIKKNLIFGFVIFMTFFGEKPYYAFYKIYYNVDSLQIKGPPLWYSIALVIIMLIVFSIEIVLGLGLRWAKVNIEE